MRVTIKVEHLARPLAIATATDKPSEAELEAIVKEAKAKQKAKDSK